MPPGAPFRGPGAPLACWALEQAVDEAAHRLGEDPIALRRRWDPDSRGSGSTVGPRRSRSGSDRGDRFAAVGAFARGGRRRGQLAVLVPVRMPGGGGRARRAAVRRHRGPGHRHRKPQRARRTVAKRAFGVAPMEVEVRIGDSRLVRGPASGGSTDPATLVPAALAAVARAAPRASPRNAAARAADAVTRDLGRGVRPAPDLRCGPTAPEDDARRRCRTRRPPRSGSRASPDVDPARVFRCVERCRWPSAAGYTGAVHVSEVEVDTLLGRTRVLRVAGGIAAGRIAAPELAAASATAASSRASATRSTSSARSTPRRGLRAQRRTSRTTASPASATSPTSTSTSTRRASSTCPAAASGSARSRRWPSRRRSATPCYNATGWRPHEIPIRPDRLLAGMRPVSTRSEHDRGGPAAAGEYRAGGTDLQQRLRSGVARATAVDLDALPRPRPTSTGTGRAAARIGALVPIATVAGDPRLRAAYPGLARVRRARWRRPQIRAAGTLGGNLLQRNRCWYFRNPASLPEEGRRRLPCARGQPPLRASASTSGPCVAPHPSTLAMALLAYDAEVEVAGGGTPARRRALRRRLGRPPRPPARRRTSC